MSDTITEIALEQLHESPFNPRLMFEGLDELAASIKAEGRIHEPLLVRPRIADVCSQRAPEDGFEIVFGHRRYRAAEVAGLATVPCMVRDMTDAEARSAQIAENLQRRDVHPLEEAVAFREIMERDGVTAERLAEIHGKSLSYVYGRLKLNALCDQLRTSFLKREIDAEVALLVARLRTDKLQAKALEYIKKDWNASLTDGGKRSFRKIRDLLLEKFTLELKGAMFDTVDALLVPEAGACTTCPKRTGNAPEFSDVADPDKARDKHGMRVDRPSKEGADVCTDPDCFEAKKRAHLKNKAAELAAKGKTVVDGNKARAAISAHGEVKGDFIALKDVREALKKAKGDKPTVVTILDPRTGKTTEAVKREDLKAAGVKVSEPKAERRSGYDPAAYELERKQRQEKADKLTAKHVALLKHLRPQLPSQPGLEELRMVVERLVDAVMQSNDSGVLMELAGCEFGKDLEGLVATADAAQLTRLAIDCVIVEGVTSDYYAAGKPTRLLKLAEHYGIQPPADESASTPSKAARALKGAGQAGGAKAKKARPAAEGQTDEVGSADLFAEEAAHG